MNSLRPLRQTFSRPLRSSANLRFNSSQTAPKAVSPHVGFYKTFARPVGKVLLMATFCYQITYWAWVKLEHEEIKGERNGEIAVLENKLEALSSGLKEKKEAVKEIVRK